nr:GNAT family N-acetyltransferase [uncultured Dongia sp.]
MTFRRLSELGSAECAAIDTLLRPDPVLSFYWATAIEDLERGIDNRLALLCASGQGVIIGAIFGELSVFSPFGIVAGADIAACTDWPGAVEIHAPLAETSRYLALAQPRLREAREMLVLGCPLPILAEPRVDHRCLGLADTDIVAAFYRTHYAETVFDPYMLFMPFVGAFEDGQLVACAGTLVQSMREKSALIGHFATAAAARNRGFATGLGRALLKVLAGQGFRTVYLATTVENQTALNVYERLGFRVADRRLQIDLMP